MTIEQAILHCNAIKSINDSGQMQRAMEMAIEALNKQIPRAPIENTHHNYSCPSCPAVFTETDVGNKYCWNCGQCIKWDIDNE